MTDNTRDIFWDIIKGIAIVLMVLGHTIQFGSGSDYLNNMEYFDSKLFQIIYAFHMPLFMTASGFLFWGSLTRHSTRQIFLSKIRSLLLPVLSFSIIHFLLFRLDEVEHSTSAILFSFLSSIPNTLWFLWSVFICSCIVIIVHNLFNDNLLIYCGILIFLMFVPLPWAAQHIFMYPFFIIGYFGHRYNCIEFIEKHALTLFGISVIAFSLLACFYNGTSFIYNTGIYLLSGPSIISQLSIDLFRWIIGFTGVIMILSLVKLLQRYNFAISNSVFSFLGRNSMGIYCFNYSVCAIYCHFTRNYLHPSILTWLIGALFMLFACLVAATLCNRIKVARLFLLGGR